MTDVQRKWGLRLLMFPFRLLGLALIFLILLSLTATIGLRLLIKPDSLRSFAVAGLEEIFHRPVQVDGAKVVFPQGIRVTGLRVLGSPSFGKRDFLTSRLLIAKLRLLPLLQRRFEISELKLWSPDIDVVRRPDGRWNLEDMFAARGGGRRKLSFLISEASLADGRVEIEDQVSSRTHVLTGVELTLSKLELETPSAFKTSFTAALQLSSGPVEIAASGQGEIALAGGDPERASLEVKESAFKSGRQTVQVKGVLQNFRSPEISAAFESNPATTEDLRRFFRAPAGLRLPKIVGTVQATLPNHRRLEVQAAELQAEPMSVTGRGYLDWSSSTPTWKVDLESSRFDLGVSPSLWERTSSWGLSGIGQISILARGGQEAGLDRFKLSLENAQFRWLTMTYAHVTGTFAGANNLADADIKVSSGAMHYYDQTLSSIRGAAEIKHHDLLVHRMDADWNGAPLSLRGKFAPLVRPDKMEIQGTMSAVKIDDLVGTIQRVIEDVRAYRGGEEERSGWWLQVFKKSLPHGFPAVSGDLRIGSINHPNFNGKDGRLTVHLDQIAPGLKDLKGQVVVDWGPGVIKDVQGLMKRNIAYEVMFLPFTTMDRINQMGILNDEKLQNFDYYKIHGDYVFRSGNMTINNFWVDGTEMVATSDGTVDWPHETLDMHIVTRVNHAKQGAAPETLSDEKGRPCLSFYVDGPMLKPDVRLDMTKVPAHFFEDFIEKGGRTSEESIKKLVRELW